MDDENDLDNIFEEYENADVQEFDNEPQAEENSANTEATEAQTREVVPVPKRIIRNPRLKFNADRLCGERGIPIVTKHFKNVKFKGKGHEKEDLNKLLSTLEHWSHRLFPSMKFEACLKQIEKLGKKRAVQTCLIKIRRDMPILSSDFVHEEEEDEREGAQKEAEFDLPPEDAFDRLFGESRETQGNLTSTPRNTASSGVALGTSFGGSLTEEQRQRMEYNKMLATERRKAKMAAMQAAAGENSGRTSPSMLEPGFSETSVSNSALESSSNLDQQFESLFDKPMREDLKKKGHESMCDDSEINQLTYEDSDMNQQESTHNESEKNLDESALDSITKTCEGFKNNPLDLEMSHHESTLEEDSEKNQWESIQVDSVTNPRESIDDASQMNQCLSKNIISENETDELGLDELMDLVDEDDIST